LTELFDRRFPADLSQMAELRRLLREGLVVRGVEEVHLERLILVVDEVVSNSIEHGTEYRQSSEPIRVRVTREREQLFVKVDDVDMPSELVVGLAQVFDEESSAAPSAMAERGRGMFLITMFLKDLEIVSVEGGGMCLQGRLHASGD
jgi:anti-sigma regulatory factor (Ser/Thr protein kinase)